nr:hypothetical protein [Flavobacterium piscinae]
MALQKSSHNFTKIALKPLRTNLFHIVLSAFFLTIGIHKNYGQDLPNKSLRIEAEKTPDSLIINKENFIEIKDTTKKTVFQNLKKNRYWKEK